MPFWKKKKKKVTFDLNDPKYDSLYGFNPDHYRHLPAREIEQIVEERRAYRQQAIKKTLDRLHFWLLEEKQQALEIATHLPQKGRTKGELLALGLREVLKNINQEKIIKEVFPRKALRVDLDHYQRQIIIDSHRKALKEKIQTLENEVQDKRQTIQEQKLQIVSRAEALKAFSQELTQREKNIDQQRAEVKTQTEALQKQLERKVDTPTIKTHKPDLERLENMLEALRRLKNE